MCLTSIIDYPFTVIHVSFRFAVRCLLCFGSVRFSLLWFARLWLALVSLCQLCFGSLRFSLHWFACLQLQLASVSFASARFALVCIGLLDFGQLQLASVSFASHRFASLRFDSLLFEQDYVKSSVVYQSINSVTCVYQLVLVITDREQINGMS